MSAQPCGCDVEAHWVCERHQEIQAVVSETLDSLLERPKRSDALYGVSGVVTYGNCQTCDGYVMNASEVPYCPSCARERRRLLDITETIAKASIAEAARQDAHAFYQPDQWPTNVLRVSDRPGAGVTAYWLRLKLKSSGDLIETWFSSMTERTLFVLSMGQWADVDQEWMS